MHKLNDPNRLRIRAAILKILNETGDFCRVDYVASRLGQPNLFLVVQLLEELKDAGLICELPHYVPCPPSHRKFLALNVTREKSA